MKAVGLVGIVLMSFLCMMTVTGCSGSSQDSMDIADSGMNSVNEAPEPALRAIDEYSWGNAYYQIQAVATGKVLTAQNSSYAANGSGQVAVFYFKPSALATYMLYDQDSRFLKVDAGGAVVRNATLEGAVQWVAAQAGGGGYTLKSLTAGKFLSADSNGTLKLMNAPDASCAFQFIPAQGNNPFPEAEMNVVFKDKDGNELKPYQVMARPIPGGPVIGWADAHIHMWGNMGIGLTIAGKPFDPLGVTKALPDCSYAHGPNGFINYIGWFEGENLTHPTDGWPTFSYWPTAGSVTHQQAYYKWLERCWLAGQRILVDQIVNNQFGTMARNALPPWNGDTADPMKTIEEELDMAYTFQDYIDAQYGGPGQGWYRIVKNAAEARNVISQGKMAVFLSIECSTIFDAKKNDDYIANYEQGKISKTTLDAKLEDIRKQFDHLYERGVRSIFPVHTLDNAFGGAEIYVNVIWNLANKVINGQFFEIEVSPEPGRTYQELGFPVSPDVAVLLRSLYIDLPYVPVNVTGMQNARGLTKTGEWLIKELIARGIVVEVSHMGNRMVNKVMDILWDAKYPGVMESHDWWFGPRMIKIMQLGGLQSRYQGYDYNELGVDNMEYAPAMRKMKELSATSTPRYESLGDDRFKTFDKIDQVPTSWYDMNDDPSDDLVYGQPMTTDANGICGQGGKPAASLKPLNYDDGSFGALYAGVYSTKVQTVRFSKQVTGKRAFDFNKDGTPHIGLVPDRLKFMTIQNKPMDLALIFNGAEAYLRMLERVEKYVTHGGINGDYPNRDPKYWPTTETEYWHDTKFQ